MATGTFVTSIVAKPNSAGVFEEHMFAWLIPHEALRREMLRADHALKHMDPVAHPWQAHALKLWMTDYFIRALHGHHHVEEDIIGPFFTKLGEPKPTFGDTKNHKEILELMGAVEKQVIKLSQAAVMLQTPSCIEGDKATVRAALTAMSEAWSLFTEHTLTHLAEEERVWPRVYEKYGLKVMNQTRDKIIAAEMRAQGKDSEATHMMFGSIIDGIGINLAFKKTGMPPVPPHALDLKPWASPAQTIPLPWVPKTFIFPAWQKRYVEVWKASIESCSGPVNVTHVGPEGLPTAVGCCGGA